jgi:hypothetical protein
MPIPLRVLLLCLIPHVWIGVGVFFVVLWTPANAVFGHDSVATVSGKESHKSKNGYSYTVRYAYYESGVRYNDSQGVDERSFRQFTVGASVPVRSLHIAGHGSSHFGAESVFDASFFGLLGWMLFWNGVISIFFFAIVVPPLRERKLARTGEAAAGVVTAKQIRPGKSTTYAVLYTFASQTGDRVDAEMKTDIATYGSAQPGDPLTVFYDPLRPKRSLVYQYIQYRILDEHGLEIQP